MQIQVLGAGGAFSPEIGNSSIIFWDKDGGLLVDCGYTVYPIIKKKNLIRRINRIFITHRHGDHLGSLDTFLYHKRFVLGQTVKFFGISDIMPYLEAIDPFFGFDEDGDQYFNLEDDGANVVVIPTKHVEGMVSHALYYKGVLFSGDTSESLLETPQAYDAKLILHEVSFTDNNVHTYFNELARAKEEIKRKTWLYHYNVGEDVSYASKAGNHGFAGFLKKDQILNLAGA